MRQSSAHHRCSHRPFPDAEKTTYASDISLHRRYFPNALANIAHQLFPLSLMIQDIQTGSRQSRDVMLREHEAIALRVEHFRQPAMESRGDDGNTGTQSFERGTRKGIPIRIEDHEIQAAIE